MVASAARPVSRITVCSAALFGRIAASMTSSQATSVASGTAALTSSWRCSETVRAAGDADPAMLQAPFANERRDAEVQERLVGNLVADDAVIGRHSWRRDVGDKRALAVRR